MMGTEKVRIYMLLALIAAPGALAGRGVSHDVHIKQVAAEYGQPEDWRYVDSVERERLFRGINVVYKDPPWLPTASSFNTNFSWVEDDAKLLSSMGFNLIRLGVMWPGVNPESADKVNSTYINEIKKLIAIAAAQGIYTILDPHQDEMNPRFCGEGAPNWWVLKHTKNTDFPVPVRSNPFPVNKTRLCPGLVPEACPGIDFPGRENCDKNSSFSYIWTHNGAKAYQTLWENPDTGFSQFWKAVAQELHGLTGVIGGELWNEPFPGDVFGQPEMRNNKHADKTNLSPFYTNVTLAIREAVPDQMKFSIAYEPTWPVGDQDLHPESLLPATSGFEQLPEANAMYAFHWYSPPAGRNLTLYLDERLADARRLKAAPYASEWNFGAWSAQSGAEFFDNVAAFESRRIAYTGWQYKNFQVGVDEGYNRL
jgi:endoglycosylceramidase